MASIAKKVSKFLNDNPKASVSQINKATGCSKSYAHKLKVKQSEEKGPSIQQAFKATPIQPLPLAAPAKKIRSDGSTASYYQLPFGCAELQHLISYKNMNAQMGEIFRETYRYGQAAHSDQLRGVRKILFYALAEEERLLAL